MSWAEAHDDKGKNYLVLTFLVYGQRGGGSILNSSLTTTRRCRWLFRFPF